MEREEIERLQAYLKGKINSDMRLVTRDKASDSVECYLGDEFVALVYKDVDEGETSYQFQMTVLSEDLA